VSDVLDTPAAGPTAIRGGLLRVAGYGAGTLLSVISAAALFRHLGVVDSGKYFTIIALVAIVGGLTDAGLTAIGVRELSVRPEAEGRSLMANLLGLRIVLTLAGTLIAAAYSALVGYGGTLVVATLLVGAGLLATNLQATLAVALQSRLRLGLITVAELVRQVLTVVVILALVAGGASLFPFFSVPLAAALVALVLTAWLVRRDVPLLPTFHRGEWLKLVRDTLPYAAATAVGALYFRVSLLLTSLVGTDQEVGFLSVSFRVVDVLLVVPALAVGAAFPIFARAARDDRLRLQWAVSRVGHALMVFGIAVALALALGASFVVDVIAGLEDFAPAVPVLRLQAAGLACSFALAAVGYALLSLRRHREVLVFNVAGLAVTAGLTAALVPGMGAEGAGVATLAAEATMLILGTMLLSRDMPLELRQVPRVLLAAALGVLPGLLGLPALVAAAAGVLVFAAALLAMRAAPTELLDAVRRR
jgi:O-antigen/teichoic acid export membrane protein